MKPTKGKRLIVWVYESGDGWTVHDEVFVTRQEAREKVKELPYGEYRGYKIQKYVAAK